MITLSRVSELCGRARARPRAPRERFREELRHRELSTSTSLVALTHCDMCVLSLWGQAPRPLDRMNAMSLIKVRPNESLSPGSLVPLLLVISSTHYNATAASLLLLATAAPPNQADVISTLLARSQPSPPPAGSACPRSLRNGSANVRQLHTRAKGSTSVRRAAAHSLQGRASMAD